jgi:hypothetical protein
MHPQKELKRLEIARRFLQVARVCAELSWRHIRSRAQLATLAAASFSKGAT